MPPHHTPTICCSQCCQRERRRQRNGSRHAPRPPTRGDATSSATARPCGATRPAPAAAVPRRRMVDAGSPGCPCHSPPVVSARCISSAIEPPKKKKRPQTSPLRRRWPEGALQGTDRLPQRRIPGSLIDAIRSVPCGHGGLRRHFSRGPLQALLFLPVLFWEACGRFRSSRQRPPKTPAHQTLSRLNQQSLF